MEKEAYAEQLMVPDIEANSTREINCRQFVLELLPFLETIRQKNPQLYTQAIKSFEKISPRKYSFQECLESILIYLKHNFNMEFNIEDFHDSLIVESVECPLVSSLYQKKNPSDLERQTLCWHCSNFHFFKFTEEYNSPCNLELYPNGCRMAFNSPPKEEDFNPLFY